ncbi:MAG: FapA family protein [Syntrophobacteraceae bacterium]|jgi:hypothetical protein|nr:FapA family protein [Syntrophobacteraceae bacterium]
MASGENHSRQQVDSRTDAEEDRILARLALKHRMVTEDQIEEAFALQREQRATGEFAALGDLLLRLKSISGRQLKLLRRAQALAILRKPDRLFARIALRNGLVNQGDIDEAMRHQSKLYREEGHFAALGELLHQRGLIGSRQLKAINAAVVRCGQSPTKTRSEIEAAEPEQPKPLPPAEVDFQAGQPPSESEGLRISPWIDESLIELQVTPDRLSASIRLNRKLPPGLGPQDLSAFLRSKGIVFGILDDDALLEIIQSGGGQGGVFEVARGIPPEQPRSAEIRVLIDPKLQEDEARDDIVDVVDLKDRGMIPQVRKGDVLAVKTPSTQGIEGVDVYGMEIPVREARDLPILVGSGVVFSQDKLQAVANVDGRPQISAYGRLSVLPELVIMGDVSFETGNIDFAGSILVGGVVQDGFKVRGGSLIAREIGKAEIDIEGDVMVFGGILGARIRTQASVKGMHIHASHIQAMGDVIVERGIVDSRISTSGRCIARRGTVLSSSIVARRGIEAQHIGSERSKPCALGIGFDPIVERQAEACKVMLTAEREESERERAKMAPPRQRLAEVEKQIGELAQEQDRALRQQRGHQERIADAEEAGFAEEAASLGRELGSMEAEFQEVARRLDALLEEEDQLKSLISERKERIREIEERIAQLNNELSVMTDWAAGDAKSPAVKVHGNIFAGTSIKGPFASVSLRENYKGVAFSERTPAEAGGPATGASRMVIQKLRR